MKTEECDLLLARERAAQVIEHPHIEGLDVDKAYVMRS
jgi:hypothetical protein